MDAANRLTTRKVLERIKLIATGQAGAKKNPPRKPKRPRLNRKNPKKGEKGQG
jgi:hypothetical protein